MHIDMHIISVKLSFQFANMIISRIGTTHAKNTFRRFQSSNFRSEPCLCIDGECSPIEPFVQTLHLDILINNIIQDNSVYVTETYLTVFL